MAKPSRASRLSRYLLDGFEVDVSSLELRDARGQRLDIPPLAFDLLVYLIEHRDRVVPKEEILDTLWSAAVGAGSLSQGIWTVRRALGDTGGAQRVIKNVRGRGYRFVADVELVSPRAEAPSSSLAAVVAHESSTEGGLIGRGPDLARLRTALQEVCAGQGRIALIAGWPGMGKTRIAAELCAIARAQGALVCQGRCFEDAGMPPFWAFQQAARELIQQQQPEQLPALIGDGASELIKLIPELAEAFPDSTATPQRGLGHERFELFDALRGLLARASSRMPLVIAIDDLHWADEATLAFLEFLAPAIANTRIALLCTQRDTAPSAALERASAAVLRQPGSLLVRLEGLLEDDVAALLRSNGMADAPGALVQRITELTGGNPFFITRLARWLLDRPAAVRGSVALELPLEARALLRGQVACLPQATRELLELAAVLGQSFHLGDLRRCSDSSADAVLDAIEPALRVRLVREEPGSAGAFRFAHPLVRETVYEDQPRSARVRLHRRIADGIAKTHADDPTSRLDELAHHYYEAAAGACAAEAVRYCRLAAERAYQATAFEDSIVQWKRALAALDLTDAPDERTRCELLLGLGRAIQGTPAHVDAIRGVFREAAERARALGDAQLFAEAAMCYTGRGPMRIGSLREAGVVDAVEIELLERALVMIGARACRERALVSAWLAFACYNAERELRRRALAREAVELARTLEDPAVLAECLMLAQGSVHGPADLAARRAILDEIIELTTRYGMRGLQLDAYHTRAFARFEVADIAGAEADERTVVRLSEELRQPREKHAVAVWRVMRLDDQGRFAEAEKELLDYDALLPWLRGRDDQGRAIRSFMVMTFQNRAGEMIPGLQAYAQKFPLPVAWHCGLVFACAVNGRVDEATRELARLAINDFGVIPDDHNWITSHCILASAVGQLGDPTHAGALYDKLRPYADRLISVGMHGFSGGSVERVLGELSACSGDYAHAQRHLERAIAENTRVGAHIWAAWSRLCYAQMLLARGQRGDARLAFEHVTTATSFARERDLAFLVAWAGRLRERDTSHGHKRRAR